MTAVMRLHTNLLNQYINKQVSIDTTIMRMFSTMSDNKELIHSDHVKAIVNDLILYSGTDNGETPTEYDIFRKYARVSFAIIHGLRAQSYLGSGNNRKKDIHLGYIKYMSVVDSILTTTDMEDIVRRIGADPVDNLITYRDNDKSIFEYIKNRLTMTCQWFKSKLKEYTC